MSLPLAPLARRSVLVFPLLLAPASARHAQAVPPFPHWVGRTALLRGDSGAARLLFAEDGTGLLTVRFLLLCRALPIRAWRFGGDGLSATILPIRAVPMPLLPSDDGQHGMVSAPNPVIRTRVSR